MHILEGKVCFCCLGCISLRRVRCPPFLFIPILITFYPTGRHPLNWLALWRLKTWHLGNLCTLGNHLMSCFFYQLVPKFHLYCPRRTFLVHRTSLSWERERCVIKSVHTVHTSSPRFLIAWISLLFTQNDALTCPYSFVLLLHSVMVLNWIHGSHGCPSLQKSHF